MTYRDYLPQRLDPNGIAVFPLRRSSIDAPAQGMSARSAKTEGLGPQDASPVPARHAPKTLFSRLFRSTPHGR